MNCFHFSVSLGYKTTVIAFSSLLFRLWIAFIFQYLWDTKQLTHIWSQRIISCELLSFFSIFGIQNNIRRKKTKFIIVVNCFHFSVSLGYKTTLVYFLQCYDLLWIAFIFQYLWDTKQRIKRNFSAHFRCELLSFFSIFGIQNNALKTEQAVIVVVNCFHFSVSLGYKTTEVNQVMLDAPLWIAFIFQYLWDTKQPGYCLFALSNSCELLSFFSIFGIQNNFYW